MTINPRFRKNQHTLGNEEEKSEGVLLDFFLLTSGKPPTFSFEDVDLASNSSTEYYVTGQTLCVSAKFLSFYPFCEASGCYLC
jgi:hypothetical protein